MIPADIVKIGTEEADIGLSAMPMHASKLFSRREFFFSGMFDNLPNPAGDIPWAFCSDKSAGCGAGSSLAGQTVLPCPDRGLGGDGGRGSHRPLPGVQGGFRIFRLVVFPLQLSS